MATKEKRDIQTAELSEKSAGRLAGKICLITGGAGNIGRVITKRFLEEGAICVVSGRNAEKLERLKKELLDESKNGRAKFLHAIAFDGKNPDDVRAAFEKLKKEFGKIDVLVNNAATAGPKQPLGRLPFTKEELAALQQEGFADAETVGEAIDNILEISWLVTRAAFDVMAEGGSVINVSTIFSRTEYFGRAAYSVPKSALNALSKHLARELGSSKKAIRLNVVYPGPIESERIRTVFAAMDSLKGEPSGSTAEHFFGTMTLNRETERGYGKTFPKPEDVANVIVFLASDESKAFNGHDFEVTNGMQIPEESATLLTSRPRLRISDGYGKKTLIIAGDQNVEAVDYARRMIAAKAKVILAFQHPTFYEKAKAQNPDLDIRHFDALDAEGRKAFFRSLLNDAPIDGVVVLPRCEKNFQNAFVLDTSEELASKFLHQEITGAIAIASSLTEFFAAEQDRLKEPPRVVFISSPPYGRSVYHDILRAAIEELIRVWRDEEEVLKSQGKRKHVVVAHQLLRYAHKDENNFDLASGFALELLYTSKKLDPINLYLPSYLEQPAKSGLIDSLYGMHLGKVAVITGGSQGIGGEIGRMLAMAGARVVLAARRKSELEEKRHQILDELRKIGYSLPEERVAILDNCDVSDDGALQRLFEFTMNRYGRIDYLINNAGIAGAEQMVVDMSVKDWRHTLKANLISNFTLMRKFLPVMKQQGTGYVLNVSSYFGGEKYVAVPYPNRADYAMSKAGQRAMAECFAKFLGPELVINAIAPGPVEGIRLRGEGNRPGLFERRAKLVLSTKRVNDLYAAVIKALGEGAKIEDLLAAMRPNSVEYLLNGGPTVHLRLQNLATYIQRTADSEGSSYTHLMDEKIAHLFIERLLNGCYITDRKLADDFLKNLPLPTTDFFTPDILRREAKKIHDGILSMLYLKKMPTEEEVALATVHYLAVENVSGETFHPSGGLRFDRTVPEGELFGKPKQDRLAALEGKTIYIFGEYLFAEVSRLVRAYIDEYKVKQVVLMTKSTYTAEQFAKRFADKVKEKRLHIFAIGFQLESGIDRAVAQCGRPDAVISTPFDSLPIKPLVADMSGNWDGVFDERDFEELVEHQLTYHFRIARKCSLLGETQIVLVTPKTSQQSTAEEFALANFVKTSLHSLTATLGVENERLVHHAAVNQVDLTRRAKSEKPQTEAEFEEELERFVTACLLTSAPLPSPEDSRYRSRIYRGNAITV
ncbi:MAG: SDR family oxidoreductase [Chloroherpetonaceae bacterium]|nr:SDR family oxidoreductase [Chloroherpetonaceae bacterium]MDW8437080.1 SDR family oxidoreductase [Chloroherpetonaceae bacterium]